MHLLAGHAMRWGTDLVPPVGPRAPLVMAHLDLVDCPAPSRDPVRLSRGPPIGVQLILGGYAESPSLVGAISPKELSVLDGHISPQNSREPGVVAPDMA